MKTICKLGMIAAILTLCGTAVNAQEYETKNDFSIGWGAGTNSDIISIFEDVIYTEAFATLGSDYKISNWETIGALSMEYTHHLNKVISLGAVAAFGYRKCDLTIDGAPQGQMQSRYYTLLPALKFDWLRRAHFGLYSKLAAGVTYRVERNKDIDYKEHEVHFNWQASPIGIEAGGKKVRAFAEAGIGEQGIFLTGIRFKF